MKFVSNIFIANITYILSSTGILRHLPVSIGIFKLDVLKFGIQILKLYGTIVVKNNNKKNESNHFDILFVQHLSVRSCSIHKYFIDFDIF
jgi:hypothetical protein